MSLADDSRLRGCGFKVAYRPKFGPALWTRKGAILPQPRALAICNRIERDRAALAKSKEG